MSDQMENCRKRRSQRSCTKQDIMYFPPKKAHNSKVGESEAGSDDKLGNCETCGLKLDSDEFGSKCSDCASDVTYNPEQVEEDDIGDPAEDEDEESEDVNGIEENTPEKVTNKGSSTISEEDEQEVSSVEVVDDSDDSYQIKPKKKKKSAPKSLAEEALRQHAITKKKVPAKNGSVEDLEEEKDEDEEEEGETLSPCEHCKTLVVNLENRMFGCLICGRHYHVRCLLPMDLPKDLEFENDQLFRKKLGCLSCEALYLPYKVNLILAWRWRPEAASIENLQDQFMSREFFVQYRGRSYWDCEWVKQVQLETSEKQLMQYFKRKHDLTQPQLFENDNEIEEADEECEEDGVPVVTKSGQKRRKTQSEESERLYTTYYKWGIHPEWLKPHRVCDLKDRVCLVKWRGQDYNFMSEELITRTKTIPGLKEAIDAYKRIYKEMNDNQWITKKKSQLQKLTASPEYLGPPDCRTSTTTAESRPSLHDYQLEGVNWLRSSYRKGTNSILADEMGLGKTVQAITLLYSLYKEKICRGPFLVTVPLSTLKNWEREFEFWAPDFSLIYYNGMKEARNILRNTDIYFDKNKKQLKFHVMITTYEFIYMDDIFLAKIPWEILVVDEAHRLKSNASRLFKSFKKYNIRHRVLLTGTPLQNNLEELFNLLNFLEPNTFNDQLDFLSQFQDISQEDQVHTLQEMLKVHLLRRLKSDVFKDLPAKEEQIVRVDMTPEQKQTYRMIFTLNYEDLVGRFNSQVRLANVMMQLRKCCNHPYLVPDNRNRATVTNSTGELEMAPYEPQKLVQACGKLIVVKKMLLRLVPDGHKVLLFSGMTKALDLIEDMLDDMSLQFERLDGSVSVVDRQEGIDRFNDPNSKSSVFLLSTKAGGLGINLCAADTVFIYDADWNPHNDIQALSRAHRLGQKNKVMIYRFVTRNSVEEKMMEKGKLKMMMTNLVITKSISKSEFHEILSFGTKDIFAEDTEKFNEGDQIITYDDEAISKLLDRSRQTETNAVNNVLDNCFSGFKVAQYEFAAPEPDPITEPNSELPSAAVTDEQHETQADSPGNGNQDERRKKFWVELLKKSVDESMTSRKRTSPALAEEELGKGKRRRVQVIPNLDKIKASTPKDVLIRDDELDVVENNSILEEDETYILSSEEEEEDDDEEDFTEENGNLRDVTWTGTEAYKHQKKDSGPVKPRNKFAEYNYGASLQDMVAYEMPQNVLSKLNEDRVRHKSLQFAHFSIVEGFFPLERMDIYNALLNFGLPPKFLRKGDHWWPSTLQHKSESQMQHFIGTLMTNLADCTAKTPTQFADNIPKDEIDYDFLIARIGLMSLINFKVNQFERRNKNILDSIVLLEYNLENISMQELLKVYTQTGTVYLDIYDGGFSSLDEPGQGAQDQDWMGRDPDNPEVQSPDYNGGQFWTKIHDYMLLYAVSHLGYDKFLNHTFKQPNTPYRYLLLPFLMHKKDPVTDALSIRRSIMARLKTLENALLLEVQLVKLYNLQGEPANSDILSIDRLRAQHFIFKNSSLPVSYNINSADNVSRAKVICQLELLINDVGKRRDSYLPIQLRMSAVAPK